jgi:signal transduction histidine kinase
VLRQMIDIRPGRFGTGAVRGGRILRTTRRGEATKSGVECELDRCGGGRSPSLFQAFANLLDNAIKYTPPRGHIEVSLADQEGHPCVTVADSGPGIPKQERDNVFRRFYRLEESRGLPGNGLGLSLVEAVANLHQVELGVEDNAPGLRILMKFLQSVE